MQNFQIGDIVTEKRLLNNLSRWLVKIIEIQPDNKWAKVKSINNYKSIEIGYEFLVSLEQNVVNPIVLIKKGNPKVSHFPKWF